MDNRQIYRARWHDYRSRCIYMVTLSKRPGTADFGALVGDCTLPKGSPGGPAIRLSQLGGRIVRAIHDIPLKEPAIKPLQYAVMPDHVHILLFVQSPTRQPLGAAIARLKIAVNASAGANVFADGFNDQILKQSRPLDNLYRYIRDNPRRLAVRRQFPEWFRRVNNLAIAGARCQAYGNMFLLDSPFKAQVVVHHHADEALQQQLRDRWLHTAANGGVLVSPFISRAEKAVRDEAEQLGGRFILVAPAPMPQRYKPAAREFALCEAGRLLIVAAAAPLAPEAALTRAACLAMNQLAAAIASR